MQRDVLICGVPFVPLHHHDGRMVRGGGLFVFARRSGAARVILHMELASAINQRAGPGHPMWDWALRNGLNELLVCLASVPVEIGEAEGDVVWHDDAEFWPVSAAPPTGGEWNGRPANANSFTEGRVKAEPGRRPSPTIAVPAMFRGFAFRDSSCV